MKAEEMQEWHERILVKSLIRRYYGKRVGDAEVVWREALKRSLKWGLKQWQEERREWERKNNARGII